MSTQRRTGEDNRTGDEGYVGNLLQALTAAGTNDVWLVSACEFKKFVFGSCCVSVLVTGGKMQVVMYTRFSACEHRKGALRARRKISGFNALFASAANKTFRDTKMSFPDGYL